MAHEHPILLVEDNSDDVFFLRRALKTKGINAPVEVASDGRAAMAYLGGSGKFADRTKHPLPRLVLLDLQLPYFTGLQVLGWIREQAALKRLPVVIFSSSSQARDIDSAYALGANSYLVKPTDVAELGRIIEAIRIYWLETNHGPTLT
ncbi:two-component system response regulator [Opitutaceae bacterium EW11]|nr:two-component system response regulator [Opitutaceae bacterium EW11]